MSNNTSEKQVTINESSEKGHDTYTKSVADAAIYLAQKLEQSFWVYINGSKFEQGERGTAVSRISALLDSLPNPVAIVTGTLVGGTYVGT